MLETSQITEQLGLLIMHVSTVMACPMSKTAHFCNTTITTYLSVSNQVVPDSLASVSGKFTHFCG